MFLSSAGLREAIIRSMICFDISYNTDQKTLSGRSRSIYIAWHDVQARVLQANFDPMGWKEHFQFTF